MNRSAESPKRLISVEEAEKLSLPELLDRLEESHQVLADRRLADLDRVMQRALESQERDFPSVLRVIQSALGDLHAQLSEHVQTEENRLFPYIRALLAEAEVSREEGGEIASDLRHEHENAAEILGRMRRMTGDYVLPTNAGEEFRDLYDRLDEFESIIREHIEVEEDVLIYRARRMKGDTEL